MTNTPNVLVTPSHLTPKGEHVTTQLLSEAETTIVKAAINIMRQSSRAAWDAILETETGTAKSKLSALGKFEGLADAAADTLQSALIHAKVHHYCPTEAEADAEPHLRPA